VPADQLLLGCTKELAVIDQFDQFDGMSRDGPELCSCALTIAASAACSVIACNTGLVTGAEQGAHRGAVEYEEGSSGSMPSAPPGACSLWCRNACSSAAVSLRRFGAATSAGAVRHGGAVDAWLAGFACWALLLGCCCAGADETDDVRAPWSLHSSTVHHFVQKSAHIMNGKLTQTHPSTLQAMHASNELQGMRACRSLGLACPL
jgi:hypothetical protein